MHSRDRIPLARLHIRPVQLYSLSQWQTSTGPLEYQVLVTQHLRSHLKLWILLLTTRKRVLLLNNPTSQTRTTDALNEDYGDLCWHTECYSLVTSIA